VRIRRWLLGFDPNEVKALKAEVKELRARVENAEKLRVKLGLTEDKLQTKLTKLEAEVQDLKVRMARVEGLAHKVELLEEKLKVLDHIADSTKENRLWIKELLKDIEDIRLEIEALKLKSEADSSEEEKLDDIELEARVYDLIRKGVSSPTKLATTLGISKDKLYRILKRLQEARLITTKGKGRKKKYIPVLEAENE